MNRFRILHPIPTHICVDVQEVLLVDIRLSYAEYCIAIATQAYATHKMLHGTLRLIPLSYIHPHQIHTHRMNAVTPTLVSRVRSYTNTRTHVPTQTHTRTQNVYPEI